jgi:hypothetical protein
MTTGNNQRGRGKLDTINGMPPVATPTRETAVPADVPASVKTEKNGATSEAPVRFKTLRERPRPVATKPEDAAPQSRQVFDEPSGVAPLVSRNPAAEPESDPRLAPRKVVSEVSQRHAAVREPRPRAQTLREIPRHALADTHWEFGEPPPKRGSGPMVAATAAQPPPPPIASSHPSIGSTPVVTREDQESVHPVDPPWRRSTPAVLPAHAPVVENSAATDSGILDASEWLSPDASGYSAITAVFTMPESAIEVETEGAAAGDGGYVHESPAEESARLHRQTLNLEERAPTQLATEPEVETSLSDREAVRSAARWPRYVGVAAALGLLAFGISNVGSSSATDSPRQAAISPAAASQESTAANPASQVVIAATSKVEAEPPGQAAGAAAVKPDATPAAASSNLASADLPPKPMQLRDLAAAPSPPPASAPPAVEPRSAKQPTPTISNEATLAAVRKPNEPTVERSASVRSRTTAREVSGERVRTGTAKTYGAVNIADFELGYARPGGGCESAGNSISIARGGEVFACFNAAHSEQDEELRVLWRRAGEVRRRTLFDLSVDIPQQPIRAALPLTNDDMGEWVVTVTGPGGKLLLSRSFQVGP